MSGSLRLRKPLTPHEHAEIVRLATEGAAIPAIAKAVGRSEETVRRHLYEADIQPSCLVAWEATQQANAARRRAIAAMYHDGVPQVQIARQFGISRARVWSVLKREGALA